MNIRSLFAGLVLACTALGAQAACHLFQISQVYSNFDGDVQYVVLREVTGSSGENFWAGQTLTATSGGVTKTFTFPTNLPSSATANRSVLVATPGFAALGIVTPDYILPANRFVPTAGGSVRYGCAPDTVTLAPLPADGVTAVDHNDLPVPATPRNFANASGTVQALPVNNIEFYNQSLDHYFITALANEIDALDTGRIAGWARTGQSFAVYPSLAAGNGTANPVCRILIPPPTNSHFFSASPKECADALVAFPALEKETDNAYYIALPVTDGPNIGACPPNTIPVYRVLRKGNHRYTTSRTIRDQTAAQSLPGEGAEGYGPDLVIMCAPPSAGTTSQAGISPPPPVDDTTPPYMPPGYGYGQ